MATLIIDPCIQGLLLQNNLYNPHRAFKNVPFASTSLNTQVIYSDMSIPIAMPIPE